jgi:arylsulfatase
MNRRELFLSSAKAALLSALGGLGLTGGAKAQPANVATGWASKVYNLIGKVTGAPGSPTATLNIPGDQLPPPPQPFGGSIELSAAQSKPFWPMRVVPPQGAPNIVLFITDDVGFAAPSTFGGVIPTPTLDRIAADGLRYTNFHTTSLCSPTRAALITGRNHHSAGFGVVSEQSTGFPGYNSVITKDIATIGRILRDNGYRTS